MGRHKKPPRKCASETCDRTITTRSLCARCQKRKQRARNKQQSMNAGGVQAATSSASHAQHGQHGHAQHAHGHAHPHAHSLAALAVGSVVASSVLAPSPNMHHPRVMPGQMSNAGLAQGFVLPISTSNALSSPSPPPLPSISDATKLHLEHDPQSIRSRQVPSDYTKADKSNVECDCCPNLEKAVINGHVPCVRSIVSEHHGNESILMDVEGKSETIFHVLGRCATLHDRDYGDICAVLLKVPRDGRARLYMDFRNEEGQTPLYVASRYHECGSHEHTPTDALLVCSMFMQHGADPSIADNDGRVPLHETTWQITHLLLQYDVDVNVQDKIGDTPLHRAALYLRANVCHELINQGQARQNITNHMGQTARDVVGTVLFESFQGTGLTMRDFEREQAITLQQFHSAPAMHMSLSPIQHRSQPRLLHAHQTSLTQPTVSGGMLPSLTSPLSYSHHPHHHHHPHHPHHQHHAELHHQADAHHHAHLAHLVQYAHHNPMGE